ncbi:MAG: N-6 DNA methylase [Nitrososphaerales archaeon]|nr:N-6 DNA methylase [Nitrososphaerales archaeon]
MPATATLADDLKALSRLDVLNDVCKGKKSGAEEDIKQKIVVRVLEWLCYDKVKDMSFEFHVANKRADVALLIDEKPKVIVETKSPEQTLDDWKVKSLQYAKDKSISWLLLSNGIKFQLYKSFIEGVENSRNRPVFETDLKHLPERFDELKGLIGHEHLRDIDKNPEVKTRVESIRRAVTEEELLETLREGKRKLFLDILPQLTEKYSGNATFRRKIDRWVEEKSVNKSETWLDQYDADKNFRVLVDKALDMDGRKVDSTFRTKYNRDRLFQQQIDAKLRENDIQVDWLDKICAEGAYTFINRILFLRICEDRGHITLRTTKEWLSMLRSASLSDTIVAMLRELFSEVGAQFIMYSKPLFDHIMLEDLRWKKETVLEIIERTKKHNFKQIDRDLLGEVYQKHISKETRRSLGQFYTPDDLINHILDQIELTPDMKVADIACGSGGFLKFTYERLLPKMLKEGWDAKSAHIHLMSKVLHGIDIDSFATQLTMMNLLLLDLENPSPSMNIYEWDSLKTVQLPHTTESENGFEQMNAPTEILESEAVQAAIGNPPYVDIRRSNPMYHDEFGNYYQNIISGRINSSSMFVRRCIDIVEDGGYIGLVLPKSMLRVDSYSGIRKYILENCELLSITDVGRGFEDVGFEVVTMVMRKNKNKAKRQRNMVNAITNVVNLKSKQYDQTAIPQTLWEKTDTFAIYLTGQTEVIASKMLEGSERLMDIVGPNGIWRGLPMTVNDPMLKQSKTQTDQEPIFQGESIGRYIKKHSLFVNRAYVNATFADATEKLRTGKIMIQNIVSSRVRCVGTYDENGVLNIDTITNVKVTDKDFLDTYVLGILNSKLATLFIRDVVFNRAELTMHMDRSYLGKVPIKRVSKRGQEEIADKVSEMIEVSSKLAGMGYDLYTATEYNPLMEKLTKLDASIDDDIFDIYGLTDDEKDYVRKAIPY